MPCAKLHIFLDFTQSLYQHTKGSSFSLQLSVRIPYFQWVQQEFSLFAFNQDIFLCFSKTIGNRAESPKSPFAVFTRCFGVKDECKPQLSFVLWHMPSLKQRMQLRQSRWSQADTNLWLRWIGEIPMGKREKWTAEFHAEALATLSWLLKLEASRISLLSRTFKHFTLLTFRSAVSFSKDTQIQLQIRFSCTSNLTEQFFVSAVTRFSA